MRDAIGPGRDGRKDLSPEQKERVRTRDLMALRIAHALDLLTTRKILWILETPRCYRKPGVHSQPRPVSKFASDARSMQNEGGTVPIWPCFFQAYDMGELLGRVRRHAKHAPS